MDGEHQTGNLQVLKEVKGQVDKQKKKFGMQ